MKQKHTLSFVLAFAITFFGIVTFALSQPEPEPPAIPPSQEQEAPRQKYHLKPEVRIEIRQMDRMELYAGGLHVGTIIFDSAGHAIFAGDYSQVKGVLGELLQFLQWLQDAARGAELGSGSES